MTYTPPTAKYTRRCSECQKYIISGKDKIAPLHPEGTNWVHHHCYLMFWDELAYWKRKEDDRQELDNLRREGTMEDFIENGGW